MRAWPVLEKLEPHLPCPLPRGRVANSLLSRHCEWFAAMHAKRGGESVAATFFPGTADNPAASMDGCAASSGVELPPPGHRTLSTASQFHADEMVDQARLRSRVAAAVT